MSETHDLEQPTGVSNLIIQRVFDAPREKVWKAWTEPERLMHWWGPKTYTTPVCNIDFRIGGSYLFCMRSQVGQDVWCTGVYREIIVPERIVSTDCFADPDGNPVPASFYGMMEPWPPELLVEVTFEEQNNRTIFALRHIGIPEGNMRDMCAQGWNEFFDKLAAYLQNEK